MTIANGETVAEALAGVLRRAARAYAPGDQAPPCAVLWLDPDRQWETVIPALRPRIPELFVLGPYVSTERSGPALWLRCVEARTVPEAPPAGPTPVFYLPGVSREELRGVEHVPPSLVPLAETQFRGTVWLHPNGKEWTPLGFLLSDQGGLGLNVSRDQATQEALHRALPKLLQEPVGDLHGRLLNAEFFNELIAPDAAGLILRWLNDPAGFAKRTTGSEWTAFSQQCKADYRFDPEKDGPMKAAGHLASRANSWAIVWKRFAEAPANYRGVVEWLRRAAPDKPSMYDTAEVWPPINEQQEHELATALSALANQPQDIVARQVRELESIHSGRRRYPWCALGLSPLAVALEPLAKVAALCEKTPGGPTVEAMAEAYVTQAWKVDAAALAVMAACETPGGIVLDVLHSMYLPWLDGAARHLQQLLAVTGKSPARRRPFPQSASGHVVLFADGLRFDVATLLKERLGEQGIGVELDWDWAPLPTVTATAKPMCSPLMGTLKDGDVSDEFAPTLEDGRRVTQDRFVQALKTSGWQVLDETDAGDPEGSAWAEAGTLDKRGHHEGWKVAQVVASEVRDLANRITALLSAGWQQVQVVTDHGWLLVPGELPKVELKAFLAEHRWGRCAAIKSGVSTPLPEFRWTWNESVRIVVPFGVGCFKAGVEYSHGGVSLQEMVVPTLIVRAASQTPTKARVVTAHWVGARCRIVIQGHQPGFTVDIRARVGDAGTSFLDGNQPKAVGTDGTVAVLLEDDADIGKHATIALLDLAGEVVHALPTTLGAN